MKVVYSRKRVDAREHSFSTVQAKRCTRCTLEKLAAEFPVEQRTKDRLASWCRACYREYGNKKQRALRREQPARVRRTDREQALRNKYGLTIAIVDQMIRTQRGCCLTCARAFSSTIKPCVDHCHSSGLVRGILCTACNSVLGLAGEDPVRLRALALYIDPMNPYGRCMAADVTVFRRGAGVLQ